MTPFWTWAPAYADAAGGGAQETDEPARLIIGGEIADGDWVSWWDESAVWPKMFREQLDAQSGRPILLEINSPGGDVFAAFEIYNALLGHRGGLTVRVTGLCASAASIIAMAGERVEMCQLSMMMIHRPWTCAAGNADELREQADVLDAIRDVMLTAYMRRFTGEESELSRMLDEETYLTPAQCVELGLADAVYGGEAQAACESRYAALTREDIGAIYTRYGLARHDRPQEETADSLYGEIGSILDAAEQEGA